MNTPHPTIEPYHASEHVALGILAHALVAGTLENRQRFASLLETIATPSHPPLTAQYADDTWYTLWHHGSTTRLAAVGPSALLDRCDLSETEHETLELAIRRHASHDRRCYVVCTKDDVSPGTPIDEVHGLTLVGIVTVSA